MDDSKMGLYHKFNVARADGSSAAGGRHADCDYFVLDLTHDQHAKSALAAYVAVCAQDYPQLATDLRDKLTPKLPAIGTPMASGFFAGTFRVAGQSFALIVAPKAHGEHKDSTWIKDYQAVPEAQSYCDGHANTVAMAAAGSALGKWARSLVIGDCNDWYLPSQDELEILYRNLKPTSDENTCWARSGINLSALDPTRPYTPAMPAQTAAEAFRNGADEAFAPTWYWTSTQPASASDFAWFQFFDYGTQDCNITSYKLRARAVRRLPI
jgi:hypothetical protein